MLQFYFRRHIGAKLSKRHADNIFKEVESFLPMNFRWTHGHHGTNEPEIFAEGISPKMGKHCDLGRIVEIGRAHV